VGVRNRQVAALIVAADGSSAIRPRVFLALRLRRGLAAAAVPPAKSSVTERQNDRAYDQKRAREQKDDRQHLRILFQV